MPFLGKVPACLLRLAPQTHPVLVSAFSCIMFVMPPEEASEPNEPSRKDQILRAYIDFVLNENRQPPSVYTFSKGLGFSESEFYQNYSSFGAVEAEFWVQVFERTRGKTSMDLAWERLRFRERVLLFAFTLTQNLLAERSFALFTLKRNRASEQAQGIWRRFHDAFQSFFEPLVSGAIESGELMNRRLLRDRYVDAIWAQTLFVLRFWAQDSSDGFERTDEAIEKGFNLTIDLMSRSAVDNVIDYGKFLVRNRAIL